MSDISRTRPRGANQAQFSGRGRSRSTTTHRRPGPSHEDRDWMEPETQYGTVEDLPEFTQISGLIETLTINGPDNAVLFHSYHRSNKQKPSLYF